MESKFRSRELVCSRLIMPLKNSSPESKKSFCLFSEERLQARQKYISGKFLCNHKIHVPPPSSCIFPQHQAGYSVRRCWYELVCQGEAWIQPGDKHRPCSEEAVQFTFCTWRVRLTAENRASAFRLSPTKQM